MKLHANAPFGPKGRLTMVGRVTSPTLNPEHMIISPPPFAGTASSAGRSDSVATTSQR
jgi:hypothetical protein